MKRPNTLARAALASCLALGLGSCAEKAWMMVPARVNLAVYERIGVVEFGGSDAELSRRATRELQQRLLDARPDVRLVDLGSVGDDPEALRDLARERGLDVVCSGEIQFSKVTPSVGIVSSLVELQARADLVATLSVRLVEAETGTLLWLRSIDHSVTVASAGVDTTGSGSVSYEDVQGAKQRMIADLAEAVTEDFRDHFFRKKVEDIPPHYRVTYPDGVEVYVPPDSDGR